MTEEKETKSPCMWCFWGITLAYLAVVIIFAICRGFFNPSGTPLDPNEWGDALAGVFSPLAFLWLIYTAQMQRAELALQRKELKENNTTQAQQHEAMVQQATALNTQVKRLEAEANARYEPIFLLKSIEYAAGFLHNFVIENVGETVFNATACPPTQLYAHPAPAYARVRGTVAVHVEKNRLLGLLVPDMPENLAFEFSIQMQRVDSMMVVHTYRVFPNEQRIALIRRFYPDATEEPSRA